MPFKHVFNYEFVFETIIKWCDINNKKIFDINNLKDAKNGDVTFFNDWYIYM